MQDAEPNRTNAGRREALLLLALFASISVVVLLGSPLSPGQAIGAFALKLGAMWPAPVYLLSAFGLGWPLRRLWQDSPDGLALQFGAGLAISFSASEILGVLGVLGPATAIGVCVVGIGLAIAQTARWLSRGGAFPELGTATWALGAPAAAFLVVAAAMPPGWLWMSEYGGYDALSYHLQLPQEWLDAGRITPLDHNVYSYLPGYIEAAFVHIGALTLAPDEGGLLAGDGWRLIACHALHAGLTIGAAGLTACATRRIAAVAGAADEIARWAGVIAGCVALATPWAVVTGSLAYNEAGVNVMLAAALLVCAQPGLTPMRRGALVGLLIGVACGFKPTALFFAGIPGGIALLAVVWRSSGGGVRPKAVGAAVGAGAAAGLLALAPWLIRNALHGGNPVFPFAAGVFGPAHWTDGQFARYASGHTFDGSLPDRIRTLFWSSPLASSGAAVVERFRGYANPQWGLLLPMAAAAAALVYGRWPAARAWVAVLVIGWFGQILAWLAFTHLQSRFLLPTLPVGAILIGLGVARLRSAADARPDARAAAMLAGGLAVAIQTGFLFVTYLSERPNVGAGVALFPEIFTGRLEEPPEGSAPGWSHTRPRESGVVYLLGDGAPLYFGAGKLYHTTYDASLLGSLVRAQPDDPAAWVAGLRERDVRWIILNPGEIARLQASGWYDPDVTNELIFEFVELLGGPVRAWEAEGRYLVRVPDSLPVGAAGP